MFTAEEYATFRRCEDFLWTVRCNLHFLAGRAEERLTFDVQPAMAERLGYVERRGLRAVERFMKHYFLVAKDVGDLTTILCSALEIEQVKPSPGITQLLNPLSWRTRRRIRATSDFRIDNGRLNVADADVFKRDPVNLIRFFAKAEQTGAFFHPNAVRLLRRSLRLIDDKLRNDPEANRIFLEMLCSDKNPEPTLRRMNEAGVLGRFVPDFGKVVSMMQFNMYHHYTVDEHLIRTVGVLSDIEHGVGRRAASAVDLDHQDDPAPALALRGRVPARHRQGAHGGPFAGGRPHRAHALPALRHERGRDRDRRLAHRAPPADERDRLQPRHRRPQHHPRLRRRRAEPGAAEAAAGADRGRHPRRRPQRLERLEGPAAARALLRDRAGGGGRPHPARRARPHRRGPGRLPRRRRRLARRGGGALHRPALSRLLAAAPTRARSSSTSSWWPRAERAGEKLASTYTTDAFTAITELSLFAPNHPRLLALFAGACAASGANISGAHISTTRDGFALDTFLLAREFDHDEDELRRARRIAETIEKLLKGEVRLSALMAKRRERRGRFSAFTVAPEVLVDNALSNQFTVVEVSGLDRPGLLFELTNTLSDLNLDITSAHITTFGEKAVDVFYVTDLTNKKITSPQRQKAIRERLLAVLGGDATQGVRPLA